MDSAHRVLNRDRPSFWETAGYTIAETPGEQRLLKRLEDTGIVVLRRAWRRASRPRRDNNVNLAAPGKIVGGRIRRWEVPRQIL